MDVTTRRGRTGRFHGRFHGRWWGGLGRGVVLGAALLVASCGGGDEGGDAGGTTAPSDGAAAEVDDGAAISTETGTAVPAWWPSQVALPDGLDIGAAAETTSGGGVLDLAGMVPGAAVDDIARGQVEALQAAGFGIGEFDESTGMLEASDPAVGTVRFLFTQTADGVSVVAALEPAGDEAVERAEAPDVLTGSGPGTATALLDGVQYVSEGECNDWRFTGAGGQDASIAVGAGLDAAGTTVVYDGSASLALSDGTFWQLTGDTDFERTETGYSVFGTAENVSAGDGTTAPASVTVECRG